jgi:hypothetical protein
VEEIKRATDSKEYHETGFPVKFQRVYTIRRRIFLLNRRINSFHFVFVILCSIIPRTSGSHVFIVCTQLLAWFANALTAAP